MSLSPHIHMSKRGSIDIHMRPPASEIQRRHLPDIEGRDDEEMSSSDWLDDEEDDGAYRESGGVDRKSGKDDEKSSNKKIDRLIRLCLQIKNKPSSSDTLSPLSIRRLDFSHESVITSIRGLRRFANLRELDFSRNRISKIDNIDHLKGLTYLNLSQNRIVTIEGIWTLSNLKTLDLSANRIDRIPSRMSSLTRLNTLKLNLNAISRLSDITHLVSVGGSCGGLRDLALAGNPVTYQDEYSTSWVEQQVPSVCVLDSVPLKGSGAVERRCDRSLSITRPDKEGVVYPHSFTHSPVASPTGLVAKRAIAPSKPGIKRGRRKVESSSGDRPIHVEPRAPHYIGVSRRSPDYSHDVPDRAAALVKEQGIRREIKPLVTDSRLSTESSPVRSIGLISTSPSFMYPSTKAKALKKTCNVERSSGNSRTSIEMSPPRCIVDSPDVPPGLTTINLTRSSSIARERYADHENAPRLGDQPMSIERRPRAISDLATYLADDSSPFTTQGLPAERCTSEEDKASVYKYLPGVRPKNALTVSDLMAARAAAEEADEETKILVTPKRDSRLLTSDASVQTTESTFLDENDDGDKEEEDGCGGTEDASTAVFSSSAAYGFPPGITPPSLERSHATPRRATLPSSPSRTIKIRDTSSQTPTVASPLLTGSFASSPLLASPLRTFTFTPSRTSESVTNVPMLSPVTDATSISTRATSFPTASSDRNIDTSFMDMECRRLRELAASHVKRGGCRTFERRRGRRTNAFVDSQFHRTAETKTISQKAAAVANDSATFASTAATTAAIAARTSRVEQRLRERRELDRARSELELWRQEIRTTNMAKSVADSEMQASLARLASSERLRLKKLTAVAEAEEALARSEMRTRATEDTTNREVALAEQMESKINALGEEHAFLTSIDEMQRALHQQRDMKLALSYENAQLQIENEDYRRRAETFESDVRSSRATLDASRSEYAEATDLLRLTQRERLDAEQLHARLTSEVSALVRAEADAKRELASAKFDLDDMRRALASEHTEVERESRTLARVSDMLGACEDLNALRRAMVDARAQFANLGEEIRSRKSELLTLNKEESASREKFDAAKADVQMITKKQSTAEDALSEAKFQWRHARNATEDAEIRKKELERKSQSLASHLVESRLQLSVVETKCRDIVAQRLVESNRLKEAREEVDAARDSAQRERGGGSSIASNNESCRLRRANNEVETLRETVRRLQDSNECYEIRLAGANVASTPRKASRAIAELEESSRETRDEISSLRDRVHRLRTSNETLEGHLASARKDLRDERTKTTSPRTQEDDVVGRLRGGGGGGRRRRKRNLSAVVECRSLRSELEEMRAKHARAKAKWSDQRGELNRQLRTSNMSDRFHSRRATTLRREMQTLSRGESELAKRLAVVESKFEDAAAAAARQSERATKLESRVAFSDRSAYEMQDELARSREAQVRAETEMRLRIVKIQRDLSRSRDAYVRTQAESQLRKTEISMLEMDMRRARALMREKSIEFPPSKCFTLERSGSFHIDADEIGEAPGMDMEHSARLALLAQIRQGEKTPSSSRNVTSSALGSWDVASSPRDIRERLRERLRS